MSRLFALSAAWLLLLLPAQAARVGETAGALSVSGETALSQQGNATSNQTMEGPFGFIVGEAAAVKFLCTFSAKVGGKLVVDLAVRLGWMKIGMATAHANHAVAGGHAVHAAAAGHVGAHGGAAGHVGAHGAGHAAAGHGGANNMDPTTLSNAKDGGDAVDHATTAGNAVHGAVHAAGTAVQTHFAFMQAILEQGQQHPGATDYATQVTTAAGGGFAGFEAWAAQYPEFAGGAQIWGFNCLDLIMIWFCKMGWARNNPTEAAKFETTNATGTAWEKAKRPLTKDELVVEIGQEAALMSASWYLDVLNSATASFMTSMLPKQALLFLTTFLGNVYTDWNSGKSGIELFIESLKVAAIGQAVVDACWLASLFTWSQVLATFLGGGLEIVNTIKMAHWVYREHKAEATAEAAFVKRIERMALSEELLKDMEAFKATNPGQDALEQKELDLKIAQYAANTQADAKTAIKGLVEGSPKATAAIEENRAAMKSFNAQAAVVQAYDAELSDNEMVWPSECQKDGASGDSFKPTEEKGVVLAALALDSSQGTTPQQASKAPPEARPASPKGQKGTKAKNYPKKK